MQKEKSMHFDRRQSKKETGVSKTILFNLCSHGHFDVQAYIDYQAGKLVDIEYSAVG